jgi:hypothetical protein
LGAFVISRIRERAAETTTWAGDVVPPYRA